MKKTAITPNKTGCLLLIATFLFLAFKLNAQEAGKTRFELSGQAMTDAGYNFKQVNPDYFDVMRPTQLPSYEDEFGNDGNVFFGVRQSSFHAKSFIATPKGELFIHLAFDLFGSGTNAGETTFHLLYAWAQLGKVGAGRHWSLFTDADASPDGIEYWGPAGLSMCKSVQFRFIPFDGENRLAFALEEPGASADEGLYADRIELADVKPRFKLPDLATEYRATRNWGYLELASVLRRIEWIDQGTDAYDLSGNAWGWGFNLSSNLKLGAKNRLLLSAVTGKGIQNHMNDAPTDIGIKNNFGNSNQPIKGVALPLYSYSCYLQHQWNDQWHSSAGWSAIHIRNSNGQNADAFRNGYYASANLIYSPSKFLEAGLQWIWIKRENYNDGWSSSANKIQFSLKYSFAQVF